MVPRLMEHSCWLRNSYMPALDKLSVELFVQLSVEFRLFVVFLCTSRSGTIRPHISNIAWPVPPWTQTTPYKYIPRDWLGTCTHLIPVNTFWYHYTYMYRYS